MMKNRINLIDPPFSDRGSPSGTFSRTLTDSQLRSKDLALEQAVTWFWYMSGKFPGPWN